MEELNNLVKIEQLPKLIVQTKEIGKMIDTALEGINELECTEDNKTEVKKRRTEINNALKVLEDKRKDIKKQVLAPYEEFNEIYEAECKNKLQEASSILSNKIDFIEENQREEKYNELKDFFEQYKETYHLDFLTFEEIGVNITLSASMKSLKDQIKEFCERLDKDIQLIKIDENKDKLMLEYRRNGYDYQKAKLTLIEEQQQLEELKKQMEQKEQIEEQEQKVVEQVEMVVPPKEIIQDEELLESTFTVKATKDKLKLLIEFMNNNGIEVIE